MSIPLPLSDEESPSSHTPDEQKSTTAEAEVDSPPAQRSYQQQAEIMDSPQTKGGVTNRATAKPFPQT